MTNKFGLAGYINSSPVQHSEASWRHPRAANFLDPKLYQDVARTLERGIFDFVFFADVMATPRRYGNGIQASVEKGGQFVAALDPSYVALTMANATTHLGVGVTRSTTYFNPFDLARTFASLDHLTGGRVAWNVVTSGSVAEANNFGFTQHMDHGERYERAKEFLELAFKLWSSWEPGAVILDKAAGRLADASKVHDINFEGKWFRSRGPLPVPNSPQGRPVIMQAGSSPQGKALAAQWAEILFVIDPTEDGRRKYYQEVKALTAQAGRNPAHIKIYPSFIPFVGETESIAREKQAFHNSLVDPIAGLVSLSSHFDHDFSIHPLDESIGQLEDGSGSRGLFDMIRNMVKNENLTLRQLGKLYGEGMLLPQLVGTASQIADQLEHYFKDEQADGFVISPAYLPGSFEEFTQFVVPELQRRGLVRSRYEGTTLRENLGLPPQSLTY